MDDHTYIYIFDYPDAMASALYGIEDLFCLANRLAEKEIFVLKRVNSAMPLDIPAQSILLIPPCMAEPLPAFSEPELLNLLNKWHHSGLVLAAACAGVFWLANAGLLNGRQVTTHWMLCETLAEKFPAIEKVSPREMVIDQGDIITAAGLYAFQDLSLHIMARFTGYELAKRVANYYLLDLNGRLQAYYQRFYPDYSHGDTLMVKAQKYCVKHLASNISIDNISQYCHLSPRTFLRRFKKATGINPKQYLIQLKIEKAKQLMEVEKNSIEMIGVKLGYSDSSNFIKLFKKVAGMTPAEFRTRQHKH